MAAGTSEHGMIGNTPGKSENAVTHMMSRSYPSARPVYHASPTTILDTPLKQASVGGARPRPLGSDRGDKSRMNRFRVTTRSRPLINLRP